MARIALVDLLFHWPPTGGSWVDLVQVGRRLAREGHSVRVFCPHMTRYFPRGRLDATVPFPVERLPVKIRNFRPSHLGPRLAAAVDDFRPNLVFFGDGYHMKPPLLPYLAKYPVVVRFYAHEVVCINVRHYVFREGRDCPDGNFLVDPARCHACWFAGPSSVLKHRAAILAHLPDRGRALHLSHEYLYSGASDRGYHRNLAEWLKIARAFIVYNGRQAERLGELGVDTHVAPSGVETSRFASVPPVEPRKDEPLRVLLGGRADDPLKGLGVLRQARDLLSARGLYMELLAAGLGKREPDVRYLDWAGPDDLPQLYGRADVVALPSLWEEPFGIAAVEAMAAGRPVVASRIGGLAGIVADGETGRLVQAGSPQSLADALAEYAADSELVKRHGQAARQRAREAFDWDVVWTQHLRPALAPWL